MVYVAITTTIPSCKALLLSVTALGLSPVQQAVVQSFLGNYANAVVCLEEAVDTCPSPPYLILLGRTLMMEHRFKVSLRLMQGVSQSSSVWQN